MTTIMKGYILRRVLMVLMKLKLDSYVTRVFNVFFQKIIDQAAVCQAKMDTATAMIEGLSGEKIRWTEQVTTFKSETERLVGDVLVLTGFLSYCGPFNQEFRVLLQRKWVDFIQDRKIPFSVTLNVVNSLTDTATVKLI